MIRLKRILYLGIIIFSGCTQSPSPSSESNITDSTAVYLDSVVLNRFIVDFPKAQNLAGSLRTFYTRRNFSYAWMNKYGLNEHAGNFLNMLNNDQGVDSSDLLVYKKKLNDLMEECETVDTPCSPVSSTLELTLSAAFFDYAKRNWGGVSNEYSEKLKWFIDREKITSNDLADSLINDDTHKAVYGQYELLKAALKKYYDIEKKGSWPYIPVNIHGVKKGEDNPVIPAIRKLLSLTGDLSSDNGSSLFDESFEKAIMLFQNRHGLKEDGTLSTETMNALRVPLHDRIQQILVNIERCRWVPLQLKGDYLYINIPAFRLDVYENDRLAWSCNAVVGKTSSSTAIFNDQLEYIVFSPYWNIPKSILVKETLPAIKKNSGYLDEHNMEVIDNDGNVLRLSKIDWDSYTTDFPYTIRQRPGPDNSLGRVKFLFPNSYGIYLHDTPSKSLFDESKRTFSHGCIRIEEPLRLAQYLLRQDAAWNELSIKKAMEDGTEKFVKLDKKMPVFIAYFTSWVDEKGKLNFRDDIYQHDERMMKILF